MIPSFLFESAEAGRLGRSGRDQGQLFYSFSLEEVVPDDHLVRAIADVLDLSWVRAELAPHYSALGRPSIDPVLMIRMLVVGYVLAIRSERALCREVQVNFAYRWFCGLGIEDKVPDHSVFSLARNERFRDRDIFRLVFERVVGACIESGSGPPAASCIRSVLCVSVTFASSHQPGRRNMRQVQAALCLKAQSNARRHQMRLLQQNRPFADSCSATNCLPQAACLVTRSPRRLWRAVKAER